MIPLRLDRVAEIVGGRLQGDGSVVVAGPAVIDGREMVATHGPREMPVWGDTFVWPEEDSPERRAEVQRKIDGLVTLLESMQKKKPAAPKS